MVAKTYKRDPKNKERFRSSPKYASSNKQRGIRRIDGLSDSYIAYLCAKQAGFHVSQIKNIDGHEEMITTKRTILQLKRTLKKVYINNNCMNNLELRGVLTQTLNDLVNDNISVDKANGVARLSDVILKTAIAEAQFNRKASTFFKSPGEK